MAILYFIQIFLLLLYYNHAHRVDTQVNLWLGWAYMTKTVRKPQRGGVNFDPPMIFCACSMQNVPVASEMYQDDFRKKIKSFALKTIFWGLDWLW
jgi:hypothetical protein